MKTRFAGVLVLMLALAGLTFAQSAPVTGVVDKIDLNTATISVKLVEPMGELNEDTDQPAGEVNDSTVGSASAGDTSSSVSSSATETFTFDADSVFTGTTTEGTSSTFSIAAADVRQGDLVRLEADGSKVIRTLVVVRSTASK